MTKTVNSKRMSTKDGDFFRVEELIAMQKLLLQYLSRPLAFSLRGGDREG